MFPDPKIPFELDITIQPSDIDELGHVNNTVYLRWVQDAAVTHWGHVARPHEFNSLFWVVMKHEIEYKRQTFLEDDVYARTWIGGRQNRHFERFTHIIRRSDGKLLAKARTLWVPISAETRKAVPLTDEQKARYSVAPDQLHTQEAY